MQQFSFTFITFIKLIFVRFRCVSNSDSCYCYCILSGLKLAGTDIQWLYSVLENDYLSFATQLKRIKKLNQSLNVCLLRPKFFSSIILPFPSHNSSTIAIFYLPLCFFYLFISTTYPIPISICIWLFFIFCLSLRKCRYY